MTRMRRGEHASAETRANSVPAPSTSGPMSTTFDADQNPLLTQGGVWIGGETTGLIFQDMMVSGGVAHGIGASPDTYDDNIACLTGHAANHFVEAVIYRAAGYAPAVPHEIELHVRMTIIPNEYVTYDWVMDTSGGYFAFRIDGPIGSYTPMSFTNLNGGPVGLVDGHVWRLRVVGSVFTVSQNGVDVATWTDTTHAAGNPGIGMFWRPHASIVREALGFTSLLTGNL